MTPPVLDDDPATPLRGPAGTPPLALIAAVARNGVIGRDNQLVWRHPEDLRWFRSQTLGCPVIMGRRTWDSLPPRFRPLPGRSNIVVTRQSHWQADGAEVAHSLDDALAQARAAAARTEPAPRRIVVIGGGQLYAQALPLADELLITEVEADFEGDTHFPDWDRRAFERVAIQRPPATEPAATADPAAHPASQRAPTAEADFRFVTYRRI